MQSPHPQKNRPFAKSISVKSWWWSCYRWMKRWVFSLTRNSIWQIHLSVLVWFLQNEKLGWGLRYTLKIRANTYERSGEVAALGGRRDGMAQLINEALVSLVRNSGVRVLIRPKWRAIKHLPCSVSRAVEKGRHRWRFLSVAEAYPEGADCRSLSHAQSLQWGSKPFLEGRSRKLY